MMAKRRNKQEEIRIKNDRKRRAEEKEFWDKQAQKEIEIIESLSADEIQKLSDRQNFEFTNPFNHVENPKSYDGKKEFIDLGVHLEFTENNEIEYEKIDNEIYTKLGYNATKLELELKYKEYLNEKFYDTIFDNLDTSSTIFLNFGTGAGKSSLIYHYIEDIFNKTDDYIIICSPYKKLVEKDFNNISNLQDISPDDIFNYADLQEDNLQEEYYEFNKGLSPLEQIETKASVFEDLVKKRVQILTVNMLLENPGNQALEQSSIKSHYLDILFKTIEASNKSVYFIFDEIHAAIQCFTNKYIYKLLKWKNLTKQVVLSTATVTEPVKVLIKHFAYLTDDTIKIFEGKRIKYFPEDPNNEHLAKLELHFTKAPYYKNTSPLDYILFWIKDSSNFHILCYSKKLSKSLKKKIEEILNIPMNLVTSDNSRFDPEKNSIGTAFKTGCNLNANSDLIIVLPPVQNSTTKNNDIFSSGVPAILQSIGRIRQGGRILLMFPPLHYILEDSQESFYRDTETWLDSIIAREVQFYSYKNDKSAELKKYYDRLTNRVKKYKDEYQDSLGQGNIKRPIIQFPTFDDIILEDSEQFLKSKFFQFGKHISPYVFWAALSDQFTNCVLEKITTYKIPQSNKLDNIFLNSKQDAVNKFSSLLIQWGISTEIKNLESNRDKLRLLFKTFENENIIYGNERNRYKLFSKDGLICMLNLLNRIHGKSDNLSITDYLNLRRKFLEQREIDAPFQSINELIDMLQQFTRNENDYFHERIFFQILKKKDYDFSKLEKDLILIKESDPLLKLGNFRIIDFRNKSKIEHHFLVLKKVISLFVYFQNTNKKQYESNTHIYNAKNVNLKKMSRVPLKILNTKNKDDIIHDFN